MFKNAHMVKNEEDAYWLKNLSIFAIHYEYLRGPNKQKYGVNWLPLFLPMPGQYFKTLFVSEGVQKNCKKMLPEMSFFAKLCASASANQI